MATLTEARLKRIQPLLDLYRAELSRTQNLNTGQFETDLKDALKLGYQELKGIILDLAKRGNYVLLAARYMEGGCPGVVSEFKATLARLYGIDHYDSDDREVKQREFWARAFA